MTDVLEKRMTDVENLVWEIPNILNIRFARIETTLVEFTGRLVALERAMSMLQADMRDLRGGVTRQLVEQDRAIAQMGARIDRIEARLDGVETQLSGIQSVLKELVQRLPPPH